MKTISTRLGLLAGVLLSSSAMAHGDHSVMTPEHGLEHAFYYGGGIVVGLLALNVARKALKAYLGK